MPTEGTWLECNGQSTTGFPELATIVGANVPDYRGIFLRGLGSQTSTHYGTVIHSSGMLGALQGDAIRNITASLGAAGAVAWQAPGGAFYFSGNYANCPPQGASAMPTILNFNTSRVVPTAEENRPINRSVRYLMRAA